MHSFLATLLALIFLGIPGSGYAQLLTSPPTTPTAKLLLPKPDHGKTLLLSGGYLGASIVTLMLFPPANWSGNNAPRMEQFQRSWSEAPVVDDGDPWTTNYVGHPFMGSFLYVCARRNHHTPEMALLSTTVMSTTWEYAIESWFEQPSVPDLIVTPTAGILLGEGRWQARQALLSEGTPGFWGQLGLFLADPITEAELLYQWAFPASATGATRTSSLKPDVIWIPGWFGVSLRF